MARYTPPMNSRGRALLDAAQQRNEIMDGVDRDYGNATPLQAPLHVHLHAAIEAIAAGLNMDNWDCVAEGFVLLQDAAMRATPPG